jgi:hypothetical protein
MPEPTQQKVQDAWAALSPKIQKASDQYPKPEGLTYAYGTAGFRMKLVPRVHKGLWLIVVLPSYLV